jgi:hypothetical protein
MECQDRGQGAQLVLRSEDRRTFGPWRASMLITSFETEERAFLLRECLNPFVALNMFQVAMPSIMPGPVPFDI